MVYVTVKEETDQKLHLSREPSNTSWALLIGKSEIKKSHYARYHIYPAIRRGFCPSRMTSNN